ncbi:MAG: hypothetical protein ACK4N5_01750, partial [Myxococcales bacterium]
MKLAAGMTLVLALVLLGLLAWWAPRSYAGVSHGGNEEQVDVALAQALEATVRALPAPRPAGTAALRQEEEQVTSRLR